MEEKQGSIQQTINCVASWRDRETERDWESTRDTEELSKGERE